MTTDQFKQIVRNIVKEEVENILPTLIPHILREVSNGKGVSQAKQNKHDDFFEQLKEATNPSAKTKTPKKFSNNPLLNEILNETEGGVPPDITYGQGFGLPPMEKMTSYKMNVKQMNPTNSNIILNEETKAQAQIGAFKDYRKLMEKIETKKKSGNILGGSIGGLSIEGGVPTDFSTID
jgi:hypothetical protein